MDVLRLTLRQLQIFIAVASHGSTAAAAGPISLSQSATSAAVNELERLLSVRLFDRVGRRLHLNDNGRALLPRARALIDAASRIERQGQSLSDQVQSLRIGASTTIGTYVLPRLLGRMLADAGIAGGETWHSKIRIANTESIGHAVAAFDLDIGLVEGPVRNPEVVTRPWIRDEMVIVGAAPLRADGRPWTVRALRDSVWLLREGGSGTREAADQALLPQLRAYRRSIEFGSSEAIKHAAILGLGVACLSRWVVDDAIRSGALHVLRTPLPKVSRPCFAVVHRARTLTGALQFVLDRVGVALDAD